MNSTTTPEPVQIPAAATAPRATGWWRRNVWWLLGTAVLGTWAIYAPYREALNTYRERKLSYPVHAVKGEWTAFHGARWRLLGTEALVSRDSRLRGPLRKDAIMLLVRFEVIPDSGTSTRTLDACRGAIVDAQGRRWESDPTGLPRLSGPRVPNTCGSGYDAKFKQTLAVPGRPFVFQHAYLLPRGQVLEGLHARVEFQYSNTAKGRYLDVAL